MQKTTESLDHCFRVPPNGMMLAWKSDKRLKKFDASGGAE
jgi:hypothetical protein